ncbi:MAG TPA: monovalent cation/H+ antiporter complex subunit F [Terriglobales bacterium]|nr:monovalent cation/H+ antiporter complex subunit F [Terriglobales bacterium]
MNAWLIAAAALVFALIPCGIVCFKGTAMDRIVGLEMAGILDCLILLLLAQGMSNPNFYDLAVALALLTLGGGLVFVRFLERWL